MRRSLVLVLSVLLVVVLLGSVMGEAAPKKKTIGVASQHLSNDWNRGVVAGIRKAIKDSGHDIIHTNARGDTNQQVADVENFIARKVDAVIIAGGEGPAFGPVLQKLQQAGIPAITIDIPSPYALCNVTSDNFNGGEKLSLYVVNKLKAKGNIVVFDTPGWHSLTIRGRMLDTVIMDYPDVKVVTRFETSVVDAVNTSYQQMRSYLLSNPNVHAVYCTWGLPAIGASRAIRELGRVGEIFVVATDADQAVLQEMARPDSPLTAVFGQYPQMLGELSVNMANLALEGKRDMIPVEAYAPIIMIEKDNPGLWFSGTEIMKTEEAWKVLYPDQPLR